MRGKRVKMLRKVAKRIEVPLKFVKRRWNMLNHIERGNVNEV